MLQPPCILLSRRVGYAVELMTLLPDLIDQVTNEWEPDIATPDFCSKVTCGHCTCQY
jgi:hypothetical protein